MGFSRFKAWTSTPVGGPSLEQRSDPVVGEVAESEGHPFTAFEQVVHRFNGPVGRLGVTQGCDLMGPALQGYARLADLWSCFELKVGCDAGHQRALCV